MIDRPAAVAAGVGGAAIVAGGLVAAVTAPLHLEHGSWTAAFLVLVAGVAQVLLGVGARLLVVRSAASAGSNAPVVASPPGFSAGRMLELAAWNAGCAAVIAGALLRMPLLVDAGGILLVVALASWLTVLRRARDVRRLLLAYRLVAFLLLVSIPVGLVLAAVRAG